MTLSAFFERAAHEAECASADVSLDRIITRAMAAVPLSPGDGPEARRLLALVAWERVPPMQLRYRLRALADPPWFRERGKHGLAERAERFVRGCLEEAGLLREQPEGRAA